MVMALHSGGTWGSALSADEFAAIRGAGFQAAGQVFGAAVHAAGSATLSDCPGAWRSSGGLQPFGALVRAIHQARQEAIGRMVAECVQLGGHGVVGVRLSEGLLPVGGLQFTALGTAVRAPGLLSGPRAPFTTDLSGQDFAKLITAGWVPVGIAQGISVGARHDDWTTTRQARLSFGNAEVTGWTELVSQCRHDARRQLDGDVRRLGAEGVVLTSMRMRVRERDCPVTVGPRDHVVEATCIGTAIASFPRSGQSRAGQSQAGRSLVVMSLDPQRRQAARIRIGGA